MNYYEILEVSESASPEVIKMAYKALVKKHHPDTFDGNIDIATDYIKRINEAYTILSDPQSRAAHDEFLHHSDIDVDGFEGDQTHSRATLSMRFNKLTLLLIILITGLAIASIGLIYAHSLDKELLSAHDKEITALKETVKYWKGNYSNVKDTLKSTNGKLNEYYSRQDQVFNGFNFYNNHIGILLYNDYSYYHNYSCIAGNDGVSTKVWNKDALIKDGYVQCNDEPLPSLSIKE